ncbi:hypothetical protein DFH29DRAFT_937177 [Suillus ampliporus]|nr:hypothetical protein DFH29DRAFT_937177 [Suillus ampliporus]
MDSFDPSSSSPYDLLETPAYYTSVSAHQLEGSHYDCVPTPFDDERYIYSEYTMYQLTKFDSNTNIIFDDYLAAPPFETTVADDGPAWFTHVPHAPQHGCALIYQRSESTYMGSCLPMDNQTMGLSISRPPAPSPILEMQDNLLKNFRNIVDNPPPHLPPRNRGSGRSHPYDIDRPHEHHGTYLCRWDNGGTLCSHDLQATHKDILAHLREYHHVGVDKDSCRCLWVTPHGRCEKQLKIQSFARHIVTHIGIRIQCSVCGMTVARNDCAVRHRQQHPNCSQADFIIIPGHNGEASL